MHSIAYTPTHWRRLNRLWTKLLISQVLYSEQLALNYALQNPFLFTPSYAIDINSSRSWWRCYPTPSLQCLSATIALWLAFVCELDQQPQSRILSSGSLSRKKCNSSQCAHTSAFYSICRMSRHAFMKYDHSIHTSTAPDESTRRRNWEPLTRGNSMPRRRDFEYRGEEQYCYNGRGVASKCNLLWQIQVETWRLANPPSKRKMKSNKRRAPQEETNGILGYFAILYGTCWWL